MSSPKLLRPRTRLAVALAAVVAVAAVAIAVALALSGSSTPSGSPSKGVASTQPGLTAQAIAALRDRTTDPALVVNVDPTTGSDSAPGTSDAPLKTIQAALDQAKPGSTIRLAPGVYHEEPVTKVDGTAAQPITIEGPESGLDASGRYQAVLYGTGRIFNINNSHYVLQGFTIDGQEALRDTTFPTTPAAADEFKDSVQDRVKDGRLIYIGSADNAQDLTDVTINNMYLHGAGGECVRIRNRSTDVQVENSSISWCGMFGKGDGKNRATYHNGEGVYIGTSPSSTDQPDYKDDSSSHVWVHDDRITTFGSECVDVKEHANANLIENVQCGDNTETLDFKGSNLELRGSNNLLRNLHLFDSLGYGLKIAVDDGQSDPGLNSAQNITFSGQAGAPIINSSDAKQGLFCGISADKTPLVDGNSLGDVAAACSGAPNPTGPSALPIPTFAPTSGDPSENPSPSGDPGPTDAPGATLTASPIDAPNPTETPNPIPTPIPTPIESPEPTPGATETPTFAPIGEEFTWEAEAGALQAPFAVIDDPAASGGRYVEQTADDGVGSESYRINVPSDGDWVLFARVIAPTGSDNSVYVSWDGNSRGGWNFPPDLKTWTWSARKKSVELSAGWHTLSISKREDGTRLDVLGLFRA